MCKIFLETSDPAKRERAVRKYVSKQNDFNKLIEDNSGMFASEIEQALIKLATGYTVVDKTIKTTSKGRFTEEKTRTVSPNQRAVEFYLTNNKPAHYSAAPKSGAESEGVLGELMEALKNVK